MAYFQTNPKSQSGVKPPHSKGVVLLIATALALVYLATDLHGEVRRLTTDGKWKQDPVFVDRSGTELVFATLESPSLLRLMKLHLDSLVVEPLHASATNNEFEPAYSADGSALAFVQSRGNLSMALVLRSLPQGTDAEIKPTGGFCGFRCPAISPDSSRVFYSFADNDRQTILSVNRAGGDPRKIIDGPGHANWPNFAPDGQRFVFGSTRDGNYEIYSANCDGSDVRRLTNEPRQDMRPRFSPDGRRIAFTSARDGNYEIYVMDADGSHLHRLTDHAERDDFVLWHPDGRRLVTVSERDGQFDLYLTDLR